MANHVKDKVIIITGAAGGFGRLVAQKCAARGGRIVAADVDVICSGDVSCLMQIEGRLSRRGSGVRAMHIAELLASGSAGGA